MHRTAWSKSSSLTSDKLNRTGPKPGYHQPQSKGKGKQSQEEAKSHAVISLETLLQAVKTANGKAKDPKGGCFCLVLTELNRPHLVEQVESELASTIAKEIEDKERAIIEAQQAVGSFPSLPGSSLASSSQHTKSPSPVPKPVNEGRTVLTLSNKKKITVSSYTTVQKSSSQPSFSAKSNQENRDPNEPTRVPPPPKEPPHATRPASANRPWENLIKGSVQYVSQPRIDDEPDEKPDSGATQAGGSSNRRRRGKGKQKADGTGS
ncbi:hypothetical protein CVT24_000217 [Panaeolus cyanescens]|uniref:Uncharacterized protein n=1 Tax=Panaeolus cyanescens TaxID=181874 RepID=A0A409VIP6_9AGAR|nr:hypothetical protein CVT24_000217 [Panaeolus cyanescens]